MTKFLLLFVVLRNFGQVTIFVAVVRKDEYASLGCALGGPKAEVTLRVSAPLAVRWQKSLEARCPAVVVHDNMWDGETRLSTLSKGHLNWLNGRLKRCDEDRSVLCSVTNKIGRLPSSVSLVSNLAPAKFNAPILKMADLPDHCAKLHVLRNTSWTEKKNILGPVRGSEALRTRTGPF